METSKSDEVRAALLVRRAELSDRITRVDRDLERRNEPLATDSEDRAVQVQNDEVLQAIEIGARQELSAIDSALQRLDAKTYGRCKRCAREIPEARLRAAPYATMCTECGTN